jgi:hypothetical protein
LSERLRRRETYHADDTERRTPRPRDRTVTTSHKLAEAMEIVTGPDGREYVQIPADAWAQVADDEAEQEVPEEEYDAEAAYAVWTALDEVERNARMTEAQAALDQLPGNDRAIMECIVQVASNARAGLKGAAQRTRQYFTNGDELILRNNQVFTTDHFEALLFGRDDELRGQPSLTPGQLERSDQIVLGHLAVLTTGGTPIMPDDALDLAAAAGYARAPQQTVGRFGVMTRDLDDEGNLRLGPFLWRNFHVAWRRYGPLVLTGLGWLWAPIYTRAEILREMATGVGPAPVRRLASRRGLFFTALGLAITLVLLVALALTVSSFGQLRPLANIFFPTQTVNGSGAGACNPCVAVTATTDTGITATATTGANPGGGCGAACGDGNATPTPHGPTPTSVPTQPGDIYATSATISFTRASQTVNAPSTLTICDGCANDAGVGTQRGQKVSGSSLGAAGAFGSANVQTSGATSTVFNLQYVCSSSAHGYCQGWSGYIEVDLKGGHNCTLTQTPVADVGSTDLVNCRVNQTGPIGPSDVNYNGAAPCSSCSAYFGGIGLVSLGRNATYEWRTPSNCTGQGDSAARNSALGALPGALGGGLGSDAIGAQGSVTGVWCSPPGNCNAHYGSNQTIGTSAYYVCAGASGWKLTYATADAPTVQKQRVTAPSGYAIDSSTVTACSSPTIQSVDTANARATIACAASGKAVFVWTSAMSNTLSGAAAGKTLLEATNLAAGSAGVVGSSVQISFSPSNATRLPKDASVLTIRAN